MSGLERGEQLGVGFTERGELLGTFRQLDGEVKDFLLFLSRASAAGSKQKGPKSARRTSKASLTAFVCAVLKQISPGHPLLNTRKKGPHLRLGKLFPLPHLLQIPLSRRKPIPEDEQLLLVVQDFLAC